MSVSRELIDLEASVSRGEASDVTPLIVGESAGKGQGVFATRKICKGTQIEAAPVVVLPASEVELLDRTVLQDYYFLWGEDEDQAAVALGVCSLCNHSYTPNAVFRLVPERLNIEFVALKDIEAGEEITINYNGNPESQKEVWFDAMP
jgi:hypothetical protein